MIDTLARNKSMNIDSLTATCFSGTTVDRVAKELSEIMRDAGVQTGYIIHNDKKYMVTLCLPYDYKEDSSK